MVSSAKTVNVAVGVVYDKTNNVFFICRRNAYQHQGNKWEFPGGKLDAGETSVQALSRELKEEIGIVVNSCESILDIDFTYPDKRVCLHVFLVSDFEGSAHGAENQECRWSTLQEMAALDFPEANQQILSLLEKRFS